MHRRRFFEILAAAVGFWKAPRGQAAAKLSRPDILRIFKVPPHAVGPFETAIFVNREAAQAAFAQDLDAWCRGAKITPKRRRHRRQLAG